MQSKDPNTASRREAPSEASRSGLANRLFYALIALCVLSALADLLYHKHVHYGAESIIGAYGIFGFLSCVVLVLLAKAARSLLARPEDYYRDDA